MTDTRAHQVLQMRLVVEADDYDEAVRFYRDVLGADEELFSRTALQPHRSSAAPRRTAERPSLA